MLNLRVLISRLLAMFRDRPLAALDEEIRTHLDQLEEEHRARGLSPQAAREAARRDFGGVEPMKEQYRDQRWLAVADALLRDVRFGLRLLVRDRSVTLPAALALALAIAGNTIVFTLVNAVLLRALPFDDDDRIVIIDTRMTTPGGEMFYPDVSYPDFQDLARSATAFDGMAIADEAAMNIADGASAPERMLGAYVSANVFRLIGREPQLGRNFLDNDDRTGAEPVVMIGARVWRTRFRGDPAVVGQTIRVNGVNATIVGVMPDGFRFPARSDLWLPIALNADPELASRRERDLQVIGRLREGVSIEQAAADLGNIADGLARQFPETNAGVTPRVMFFRDRVIGSRLRSILPLLLGLALFVLLIASANVANLLLARAALRRREISLRMAMGASRTQVIRQLLVESLLLAALAGVLGLSVAAAGVRALANALGPGGIPYWIELTLDVRAAGFLVVICGFAAVLFGLMPAWHMAGVRLASALGEGDSSSAGGMRARRWTAAMVVVQLALTPVLLTGGGLMLRRLVAIAGVTPGVDISGVVRARVDLTDSQYPGSESKTRFYQQLDERLAALPQVDAALATSLPFGGGLLRRLQRDDEPASANPGRAPVWQVAIGPRYFETLGVRLRQGVDFTRLDAGEAVAIVNEQLAATVFPDEDPIGRRIRVAPPAGESSGPDWFTVIGVAPNIRQSDEDASAEVESVIYLSFGSNPPSAATIVTRSRFDPGTVADLLRSHVNAIDPDLALFDVMTFEQERAMSDARRGGLIFGGMFIVLGALALVLTTLGLYAVTAYAASQRTREIGVRVALGAARRQIWWLVTRRIAWQLVVGTVMGIGGSAGLAVLLQASLADLEGSFDWITLGTVCLVMAVVTCVASGLPARRAMRVNPVVALRTE